MCHVWRRRCDRRGLLCRPLATGRRWRFTVATVDCTEKAFGGCALVCGGCRGWECRCCCGCLADLWGGADEGGRSPNSNPSQRGPCACGGSLPRGLGRHVLVGALACLNATS